MPSGASLPDVACDPGGWIWPLISFESSLFCRPRRTKAMVSTSFSIQPIALDRRLLQAASPAPRLRPKMPHEKLGADSRTFSPASPIFQPARSKPMLRSISNQDRASAAEHIAGRIEASRAVLNHTYRRPVRAQSNPASLRIACRIPEPLLEIAKQVLAFLAVDPQSSCLQSECSTTGGAHREPWPEEVYQSA